VSNAGATTIYREEDVWESDSKEYALRRRRKRNAEQGNFMCFEQYAVDKSEDTTRMVISRTFEVDERYCYLACKAYLENVGFIVSKS
jgi:hypothetical protein